MIKSILIKFNKLETDDSFSEILLGSSWALSSKIVSTVISFVLTVITARYYGPDIIGIVAILNTFLMLATTLTVLGTNTSILRLIPEYISKYSFSAAFKLYRKVHILIVLVSILSSLILCLMSNFIASNIFHKPYLHNYFLLASLFILFESLMKLNTQAIRGLSLIKTFSFMQLLPSLSKLLVLITLTVLFFNKSNPVYAMFTSIVITSVIGSCIIFRKFNIKSQKDDPSISISLINILSISLPMFLNATIVMIVSKTGIIVLGIYRSEADVGFYNIALTLATMVLFIISAVNSMAASKFSQLFHSDKIDELFKVAQQSAKLIFWTTAPLLLILVIFGKPLLSLIYGSDFERAYFPLVFLSTGQFVTSITGSTGTFMNMTGLHKHLLIINILSLLINLLFCMLFIPKHGINGAAIATMSSMFFLNVTSLLLIKIKHGKTVGYFPNICNLKKQFTFK